MYRRMHVLVEGRDDKEFFKAVVVPILEEQYDHVQIWEYAGKTLEKRRKYVTSIRAMEADYLFVADINSSPCVTQKKSDLVERHNGAIDANNVIIVVKEIESWYLAGLGDEQAQEIGVRSDPDTNDITKELFRHAMPKQFEHSVVDFMAEILNRFDLDTAKSKNRSFCYLMNLLEARLRKA